MAAPEKIKVKGRWFFIKAKPTQKYKHNKHLYSFYKAYTIYKRRVKEEALPAKIHGAVVNKFFEVVSAKIVGDGFIFYMPYGLGNIRINKVEYKGLPKQKLFFKSWNKHYSIQWDKENARFKNKHMYHFKLKTFLQYMKYDKIERANENPMESDIIGYNERIKAKYNTSEVLRKRYAHAEHVNIQKPVDKRLDMEELLKQLENK